MKHERAFYATTLGMVLTGAYAMALGAPTSIFPMLTVGVCVINWMWYFREKKRYLPDGPAALMCALVFLITMARAGMPTGYGVLYVNVPLAGELLLVVQWILIFRKKIARDYAWIYVCSAMLVVSGLLMVPEMRVVSVFMLFGFLGLCAMSLLHIRAESERAGFKSFGALPLVGSNFFTRRVYFGAVLLLPTALIFISMPRISPRYLPTAITQMQSGGTVAVTGFSETVELGDMGTILESPEKVMEARVTLPDGSRAGGEFELLLRGRSYARYDGISWRGLPDPSDRVQRNLLSMYEDDFGWYARDPNEEGEYITVEVRLEPLNTRMLFVPFAATDIEIVGNNALRFAPTTDIIAFRHPRSRSVQYTATSRVDGPRRRNPPPHAQRMETDPAFARPPAGLSPALRDLAFEIAPEDAGLSLLEIAERMEIYLKRNYQYSLSVPHAGGIEPIESFLLHNRVGYCEHFASAMVVLLRLRGIPARLVTGFKGGEWNSVGRYFTIRQMDAHSWVEAYIQPYGWVTFDPTGFSEGQRQDRSAPLGKLGDFFSYLQMAWVRYIIAYDQPTQEGFLSGIRDGFNYLFSGLRSLIPGGERETTVIEDETPADRERGRVFGIAMLLVAAVFAAALTMLIRRRRNESSIRFYDMMLKYFRRKGLPRQPGLTPREFAEMASERYPQLAPAVRELTESFCRARYAGERPKARDEERLLKTARNLGRMG